jgi:hypothetical protein
MTGTRVSMPAWAFAVCAIAAGAGFSFGHAAGQDRQFKGLAGPRAESQKGRAPTLTPPAIRSSKLTVRMDLIGRVPSIGNLGSPVVAGSTLILIDQGGSLDAWDGTRTHPLLTDATLPADLSLIGPEAVLNVAANGSGNRLYVMFTSSTVPDGIPQRPSPRAGANAWHVLYGFDFDGTELSNARAITALQVRSDGHTGGGLTMAGGSTLIFATGDNGDAGEDGRAFAQDPANHLGKLVRIDVLTGATEIAAIGMRNVQRLIIDANSGDPHLIAVDIGGWIAEEIDALPLAGLLSGARPNCGWGRHPADGKAREGTFYIDANGAAVGSAPLEPGFVQPIAQFGREGAELIGATGPVASTRSFRLIRYLFGDLVSGSVYALTAAPTAAAQNVYRVALIDNARRGVTLQALAGGTRPDPRFFNFPDGSAGVLLETTGEFYRLTEIR